MIARSFLFRSVASTLAAAGLLLALETPSRADESTAPAAPAAKAEWYGWQTLATDGVATGTLVLAGASAGSNATLPNTLLVSSATTYALGGPIVHAAHGRWSLAFADLGLRVGAAAAGGAIGYGIGASQGTTECSGFAGGRSPCWVQPSALGLGLGAAAGVVTASVLDATWLAREPQRRDAAPAPSFSWSPTFSMVQGGGTGGVTGSF